MKTAETFEVKIYIAGDIDTAKNVAQRYCTDIGLCVTVAPLDYIYSGGREAGMVIGFINYPRYPDSVDGIEAKAVGLADLLLDILSQWSYTIVMPENTIYKSIRGEG
jgi:hypothetical protein